MIFNNIEIKLFLINLSNIKINIIRYYKIMKFKINFQRKLKIREIYSSFKMNNIKN